MTEGLAAQDLWAEIHADARASYRLDSKEVDWAEVEGESKGRRAFRIGRALFWAMLMKLTPARRVLLLAALILLVFPSVSVSVGPSGEKEVVTANFHFLSALILFVLLALELAERVTMKRDLEIARDIQRWLMPEVAPQVPGVDIAFATRGANTVAGDYYDAVLRPAVDGGKAGPGAGAPASHLLLVVADVAGKSVPAALLMATFQASLRTLAMTPSPLPDLVGGLNTYACAHSIGGRRFTTAFLAEFDPATLALIYVRAGHNLPVLRRSSGGIERLEVGGLPLGIRPGIRYDAGNVALGHGDLLVIFTDGVVEAENDREEEYGEARLLALLAANPTASASALLQALMASIDAFVGAARQHDDITCLIMRAV